MRDKPSIIHGIRRVVRKLSVEIGPRPPGSQEEKKTAAWIGSEFEKCGLPVKIEKFEIPPSYRSNSFIKISGARIKTVPVQFSPLGHASGRIVFLGNEDMSKKTVFSDGDIGILMPMSGLLSRHSAVIGLEKKGLGGLVVISPLGDTVNGKIVREPGLVKMPVVTVTNDIGEKLMGYGGRNAELHVYSKSAVTGGYSQNIIASIKGSSPRWMAVCSHYDTAASCPGATDNAGGISVLLETAKSFCVKHPEATVHFVASGCEEYGTDQYTGRGMLDFFSRRGDDLQNCICLVDVDEIGHRIGTPTMFVGGPCPFRKIAGSVKASMPRLTVERWASDGGDNAAAYQNGIPHIWYYDHSMNTYYHSPKDTIRHFDAEKTAVIAKDVCFLVDRLSSCRTFTPFIRIGRFTVRPGRFHDIPEIVGIMEKAYKKLGFERKHRGLLKRPSVWKSLIEDKKKEVEDFCRRKNYQVIVAEFAGKIVGFATCDFNREQDIAEIRSNIVHPEHQGKGIERAMLSEIDRRAKEEGYGKFKISALSVEKPMRKLYENLDYSKYAESVHYFREGSIS